MSLGTRRGDTGPECAPTEYDLSMQGNAVYRPPCENTAEMGRTKNLLAVALLSAAALASATLTAYWLSILARGDWKYPELILPICAAGLVALLIVGIITRICTHGRNKLAMLRLAVVLLAGCSVAASGVFFGALDNCRLSCGTHVKTQSKSPSGNWTAIYFTEKCVSVARYCPTIWHVSVVGASDHSANTMGKVFSIDNDPSVELEWKSDNLLLIRYWPAAGVLRRREGVGAVRIEFQPFPIL